MGTSTDIDPRLITGAGAGATEGSSRVGGIRAIPLVLAELGFDPAAVLAEVGVDARLFDDPNNLIRDALIGQALVHCVARTGCEDFALRVGRHGRLASLGLVGTLTASAPDVGAGLRVLSHFLSLNDGGAVLSLTTEGSFSSLNYAIYEGGIEGTRQIHQMVSAVACNVLRDLCGPDWAPSEVLIPCRRPRDVHPFRDFFRAPLRFDSARLSLVFPHRWLEYPLRSADPALHAVLGAQAAIFEELASPGLPSQVRRVMRNLLLEGKGSIEAVARRFSMHRRTLDRHLDASGSSFRTLADETRFEVACQLLRDTQMAVGEIATSLHYGDSSAFAHAFRRWSGETPTRWRESVHRAQPESADAGASRGAAPARRALGC
jgi:AraC-like DNA-binding protein